MLRSNLYDYSDAYILVSGTIKIDGEGAGDNVKRFDERNKGVIFKNCAPFTDCISEINNTQIDNVQDLNVVMPMYNLIEYSNNYSKTSGSLWQYYRDDPNDIVHSESFKFKINLTGRTPAAGNTKNFEIGVPSEYLSNFWRTLEMLLIYCEIYFILTWSVNSAISSATGETRLAIAEAKLDVPVVTLPTQGNAKLLEQLRSGFKRRINWNKYQSKVSTERQNHQYLDFLIDPSFQGVNMLFVLSFKNEGNRKVHTGYYLPKVEIKDYNIMIDGKIYLISQLRVV